MNITEDQKTVRLDATYPQTSSVNFSNTHSYAQESNTISELSKLNPSALKTQDFQAQLAKSKKEALMIYKELKRLVKKEKKKAMKNNEEFEET